jgi:regulator of sirC expression with transglutaminase-like and TPR domain
MDFGVYAAQPDDALDLLQGALLIAQDEYPSLDLRVQTARIDELAAPLRKTGIGALPVGDQIAALAAHLFERWGFRGNEQDYYDPRNSFLNDVLDRRLGIPITLAILYVEVAARAGVTAQGVGFPGHFLVRVDAPGGPLIVDPFRGGGVLDGTALSELLERGGGGRDFSDALLEPAPVRKVLVRMLMNLRSIYASRGDYSRLLVVLDRIVDLLPGAPRELRDRGLLSARLGAPEAAMDDLRHYVRLAPHAGDVAEVRRIIDQLEQGHAAAN